jgi:heat shock protein HtpX
VALLLGFALLVVAVGWVIQYLFGTGLVGVAVALAVAGGMAIGSYYASDKIALSMSRAVPADPQQFARYHNLVEGLCIASGLPKPRLYVVDDPAPNAFATGRNPKHAAIAVTTGLLEKMNRVELEGVLAHELSHVKNYDILVSTLAVTLVGVLAILADLGIRTLWWNGGRSYYSDTDREGGGFAPLAILGFALLVLAPIIAQVMQFAVSRRREALADVSAIDMTRYPPGLISALEKLRDDHTVVHSQSRATAHLWIEHPIPLREDEGRLSWFNRLFLTHPPLDERIAALREL